MKTNILYNMVKYRRFICTVVVLLGMNVSVWGLTLTFDFTSNVSEWPTSDRGSAASKTYTLDGTTYTFALGNNVYCNSGYLMLKYTTYLGLPAISGKVLTNVSVCNSSDCSTGTYVAVTSNTTGTAVTGGTKQNFKSTSYVYRYTLSGTSANTMYYLYITDKNCQITKLMLTYENTSAYTVTYDAENGTCSKDDDTEVSANAGVTLPTATSNVSGWEFAGWATETCDETTTAPRLYLAGETYYPDEAITLHAVYRKMTDGTSTSTATFTASTESGLTNISKDPYIKYWWLHTSSGIEYYIEDYGLYSSNFNLDDSESDGWALLDAHRRIKQVVFTARYSDEVLDDIVAYDDGSVSVSTSGTTQTVTCSGNVTQLMMVAPSGEESYISSIVVTYYDTKFNSNPCGNIVTLSGGTKTNVSSISFSSDEIQTCSSTAANRQVTVTVTTNTGYKMVSDLGFAKTGTVTATKKSGPTGSGPYTYVYEFNQNDNGTGTFSATATAKTYTVTLDGNGGTGHTANVTTTYNSSTLSSSITNPTKTGYTFDGWYNGSGGTGSLVINTSGVLQANVSTYTGTGGIWTKDAGTTLYAKWTINKYKVTLAEPSTVTINATDPSSIAEGGNASINYNTEVTLSYSSLVGGRQWCGWKVYKDGDPSTTVTVTSNKFNVPAYDVIVDAEVYGSFTFSCADLQLDEPDNGADNVLSDVIYLTSTSGQKVRSTAHFHVHGDGLTPSQTVKFTTGSDALDALYTFRKADGTEVETNASGTVDEEVYIFYQPTATTDGRDEVTSLKAYVERKGDGSGKPKAVVNEERTINGRHLPAQFIIAAKAGDYWYALPADMVSSSAHAGYSFTPNSSSAPTQANVAPEAAVYNFYGYATSSPYDSSFIRLASDKTSKALWSNKSNSSIGITNKAAIDGGSAKGEQYEWRLTNTGADTYNLWNHAANLTGRNLGLQKSDKKWNMYADGSTVVKELRILPVVSISAYIELLGEDWQESAFTYTKGSGTIPEHHHIQVTYNGDTYTATESGTTVTITDADFAAAGGFAAAPGTQLTLEWCNEDGAVLAQGSLFTPIFITSNTVNLSDYEADVLRTTDVFITNGAKLTVNENTTVHDVTVNAGSTLLVDKAGESTGATLTMSSGKLTLRGGWTTIGGDSKYDMPRVYINPLSSLAKTNTTINLYMDIFKSEDGKHYYPFAVPFAVAVNDVKYVDPTLAAAAVYNKHYVIKRYNGANRAENGTGDGNWEVVPAGSILKPGEGYIITAVAVGGKAQLVVPMKNVTNSWLALGEQATVSDSTKNVIKVTAHTGTATAGGGANNRHKGWNMVGVPFMSCYTSGTDMYSGVGSADLMSGRMELSGDVSDPYAWETSDVVYVSVPTHDFSEYIQTDITTAQLVPGWSFFIQVGTTGNLTFLTTKQAESSSTPLYAPQRETSPIVKTGIVLTGGEKSDKTTLIISDRYCTEYEIGADLEKMFGNGYTLATYSITGGMQLAFNAMSTEDVKQVIPVGVRLPEDGEYTFSLNSQYADADIERLDLIDYETGEVTNLMMSDYRFTATRSQNNDRFALNVVPMVKMPTGVEDSDVRNQNSDVRKIILDDKMFIIRDGLMYDATGKRVVEINK